MHHQTCAFPALSQKSTPPLSKGPGLKFHGAPRNDHLSDSKLRYFLLQALSVDAQSTRSGTHIAVSLP